MITTKNALCLALILATSQLWAADPFAGKKSGAIGIVQTIRTWPAAADDAHEAAYALSLAVSPDGAMYLLDGHSSRIFVWDQKGRFSGSFGGEGKGPGEIESPLLMTADEDHVHVCEVSSRIITYTRGKDGRFSNDRCQYTPYKGPTVRVAQAFKNAEGQPRVFVAGHTDARSPHTAHVFNPLDGELVQIPTLTFNHQRPSYNILNMDDPKQPLYVGSARAWAAMDSERALIYGFSGSSQLWRMTPNGKTSKWLTLKLPQQMPADQDIHTLMTTPTVFLEKSIIDFEKMLNAKFNVKTKEPMAAYTHFLLMDNQRILFMIAPFGGFQLANYVTEALCLLYDAKTGKTIARGRFKLEHEQHLFPIDNRLFVTEFNDDDLMVVREVRLGWVD